MNNETVNYSDIAVAFDQTDVERATRGNMPVEGWYKFTVTGAIGSVSKNKGSMMFVLDTAITDADGNTRGKALKHFIVLPLATPKALLSAAGFPETFKHSAPNTSGLVRSYLEATRPTDFPHNLTYDKDTNTWTYNGQEANKQEVTEVKKASANAVLAFVTNAWSDPAKVFVGDSFYGKLSYREGRDFPSIGAVRTELPEGESLVG